VTVKLDHVIFAVADLAAAAQELEEHHGLAPVAGGRHPGWGTENRIVPLGDAYLELIAVADEFEAAASPFGRWVAAGRGRAGAASPLGWAVRTDDLDAIAERLALEARAGSRRTGDGAELRWRYAGVERAMAEACLPFFIEWAVGTPFPGRTESPELRIRELHLTGEPARLAAWLGPTEIPVAVEPGRPAVVRVVLDGPGGSFVFSGDGT
jgi:glyoxalase-like protein